MRFVANPNFQREIEREVEYRAGKVRVGEEVVQTAKGIAPVRTGAYRDSLKTRIEGPRVYVTATDFKGHWIEWGTIKQPAKAVIRRACRMVGLNVNEVARGATRAMRHSAFTPLKGFTGTTIRSVPRVR
jgi:hypothetical protein